MSLEPSVQSNQMSWTGEEIKSKYPDAQVLEDVLGAVNKEVESQGQVVCEVKVNGLLLDEEEEKNFFTTPVSEINDMVVQCQDPNTLLDESLESGMAYLDRLIPAVEQCSALFRGDDLAEAHTFHFNCVEGAVWFVKLATHFKLAYLKFRGEVSPEWQEVESRFAQVLGEVLEAYEKKNYILVADLLEYELLTTFEKWREILNSIAVKK